MLLGRANPSVANVTRATSWVYRLGRRRRGRHGVAARRGGGSRRELRHLALSMPAAVPLAFRSDAIEPGALLSGEGGSHVNAGQEVKNIVLVHGGFVDGSG